MKKVYPFLGVAGLVMLWQLLSVSGVVPAFALPSPVTVLRALASSAPELAAHTAVSLYEGFLGLTIAVALAVGLAVAMDALDPLYRMLYPLFILTQTVPVIAVAPLLVLWMGYGIAPKVALVVIVCFFPLAVGLLDGFKSADKDMLNLLKAMGANPVQLFLHGKLPMAAPAFFSGLKIAVSYAVVGAVIAEWLGGSAGLGVYMMRVRKSYAFDKMFAAILIISAVSLLLMKAVALAEKKCLKHHKLEEETKQ